MNKKKINKAISQGRVAENRRAKFDYSIIDTVEAGIVLLGSEVKSLRLGRASINESYATNEFGQIVLVNSNIPEYNLAASGQNHDPKRVRRLLVHKKENREEIGKKIAKDINAKIIPPFDDEKVIIGQGTAGIECIEQLNEINVSPDIVLCCCGGGGLIAGISTAIKEKFQNAKIYSVEPENFDDTKKSLKENSIIPNSMKHNSICDALLADKPGKITFEINKLNLTSGLSVSDKEALIAMNTAFKYLKIVLEPGGAVALAAAIFKKIDIRDKNVLVIASGGNVDKDIFENCLNQQAI